MDSKLFKKLKQEKVLRIKLNRFYKTFDDKLSGIVLMTSYVIETKNLTKKYKKEIVLDSVNIKVEKGKIYGLLGKNGAGKTTTMSIILNLAKASDGEVKLFGLDFKDNPQVYLRIGSIIETPGFYYNLTGFENLQILAELRGNYDEDNVNEALKIVSLDKGEIIPITLEIDDAKLIWAYHFKIDKDKNIEK